MSLDRLFSVCFPLRHKYKSVKASKIINTVLLAIGIAVSLIPVLTNNSNLFYFKIENILTIPDGIHSLTFLLILFVLPIATTLFTNIVSQYSFNKHLRKTYRTGIIQNTYQVKRIKREQQLSRTLKILSLYYTISSIPLITLIFVSNPITWNKNNLKNIYIPKLAFFNLYKILFFSSLFLMSFNGMIQVIVYFKNDIKIKLELQKIYDKINVLFIYIHINICNRFINSCFIVFINFLRMYCMIIYERFIFFLQSCFIRTSNRNRVEVIPPPKLPQSSGRANVYFETNF